MAEGICEIAKNLNAYKINNLIVKMSWIFVSNYFDEDRKRSAIKVLKKGHPLAYIKNSQGLWLKAYILRNIPL